MITLNEGNILEIKNEKGILTIEDDIQDGMSFDLSNENIALSMVALLKNDELRKFLNHEMKSQIGDRVHFRLKPSIFTQRIGVKQVLEMFISDVCIEDKNKKDFKIIFISQDTTYTYPLEDAEWEAMTNLIRWVSNDYK